jgi:maleylacetate reductase
VTGGFACEISTGRVLFEPGARAQLADEAARLKLNRLMVVCTPGHAAPAHEMAVALGDSLMDIHAHAAMHVPAPIAATAVQRAGDLDADGCIAIGGGSAIGLGKVIAKETGVPLIAVPTTYAGSEMTPIWGLTDGGRKSTGRDARVRPRVVIYDPELTLGLPPAQSVTSAVNALAHAAEALYAPDNSPLTDVIAAESAQAIVTALPQIVAAPCEVAARSRLLYGAWLAGVALGSTTMSLHHQLCHVLGGTFDLPHAETHTALLPHVLALNLEHAPRARERLQSALGAADPATHLFELIVGLGARMSLHELGMPSQGITTVIDQVLAVPYPNVTPVTREHLETILSGALAGTPPRPHRCR